MNVLGSLVVKISRCLFARVRYPLSVIPHFHFTLFHCDCDVGCGWGRGRGIRILSTIRAIYVTVRDQ